MTKIFKRIFLSAIVAVVFGAANVLAAPFAAHGGGDGLLLAEVECYGEKSLQREFLETFREEVADALNASTEFKTQVHLTAGDVSTEKSDEEKLFSLIHMDAVVYGPLFEIDKADARTIRHARARLGKEYFWDDEKMKVRRAGKFKPYSLPLETKEKVREIGESYGVKYMLFCNLLEVDTRLKHSIFSSHVNVNEFRAKKLRTVACFYLVDTRTGKVYEGLCDKDKTGQILSLIGRYGQAATVQNLLQCLFEVEAQEIVKLCGNAKKTLAKGGLDYE